MRVFSVNSNSLKFGDRLVPSFYYYTEMIKEQNIQQGITYIKLGKYSTVSDGEHSAIPRNSSSGIRYLYGRNVKEGVIDFDPISDDPYIDYEDYATFGRCHVKQDDVLIAIYGTVGKSALYKEEYVGIAGIPRHISNISIKGDSPITPEYLTSFFRSRYGKWQMFSLMTGNIQQLLSLKNIREFDVPLIDQSAMDSITAFEKEAIECEIAAHNKIEKAKRLFYSGLKFDIKKIKRDFCFTVSFSQLDKDNIWSTSYYDNLYIKMADALKQYNNIKTLRELTEDCHGDEVGSENYKTFIERDLADLPFIRTSDIVNNEIDLYPDYYVDAEAATEINQDVIPGDVLFTKDGKIGCVGMITRSDKAVLSSGIVRLRLKKAAIKEGFTQEYLFIALAIPEVGLYAARRRTVVASTIPHLRIERLRDIEIPVMDKEIIDSITELVKDAFELKAKRKAIIKKSDLILERYFT